MRRIEEDLTKLSTRTDEIVDIMNNSKPVEEAQKEILEFLDNNPDIKSVCANQLGFDIRMFCIRFEDETVFFMNPMIVEQNDLHISIVEDLSLPDKKFMILLPNKVTLNYQDIYSRHKGIDVTGTVAEVMARSVDILDGITIDSLGIELHDDYFEASEDEQKELQDWYLDYIKNKLDTLNKEIDADPEMKKDKEAIEFLNAVSRGEVTLDTPVLSHRKQKLRDKLERKMKNLGRNFTKKKKHKKR